VNFDCQQTNGVDQICESVSMVCEALTMTCIILTTNESKLGKT